MVVLKEYGGVLPLAVGHEEVGLHTRVAREVEGYLPRRVALSPLRGQDFHVEALRRGRRQEHLVAQLVARCGTPLVEVLDVAVAPGEGIGERGLHLVKELRQVVAEEIGLRLLRLGGAGERREQREGKKKGFHLVCFGVWW